MTIGPQLAQSPSIHPILRTAQAVCLSLYSLLLSWSSMSFSLRLALNSGNLSYQLHPCITPTVLCSVISFPTYTTLTANIHSNVTIRVSEDCFFFVLRLFPRWSIIIIVCVYYIKEVFVWGGER